MISLNTGILVTSANTPLDVRTKVGSITNLTDGSIIRPYVGLIVWVTNEEKAYAITGVTGTLITSYKPIGDDVAITFAYTVGTTKSSELSEAIGANKIITIGNYVASVEMVGTGSSAYYVVSYTDKDGVFHQITHTPQADSTGSETTKEFAEVSGNLSATSNIASAGFKNYQGDKVFDIGDVDTNGTLYNKIKNAVRVDVDTNNNTFGVKNIKGDTIGTITLSTAASGAAVLTFADNNNGSFVATLPNLRYDSDNQMLKMVNAGGIESNLIRLSNLQIKEVIAYQGSVSFTPAMGDLILEANSAGDGYILEVFDGTDWQSLGSINNVSLQADQVSLTSTKLNATNVKGGLEELYDKVDAVGASYWTGSIGISSATAYSKVSGLTEYNKQSEPIDVYVTTAGYLWIVSSVKIIAETSGIEIPMLAPVKSGDLYYYRSEEIVKESISVMVKALAKQEGTDPNNSVTIISSIGSDSSYTVGDTATTLSVNANSNNGGYLGYQWEKNGFAITDANSSTYTPSTSSASDSGTYRCKVTNLLDNGYEYTNIVVIEVKESQGGDTTSDWLEDTGVVHGEIATLQGYSLSPAYQIDNGDVIYAWVGENNSDQTKKIISGWVGDTWKCGWNEIKYNGRLVNTSEEAGVNNIRVMIRTSIIDKCFIYNCTKSTWLYKGASLGNVYNGFEWCKWVKTGSAYGSGGVLTIQDAKQSDATLTQTHMSPLIPLQPNHILSFKTGLTNSNGGYAKMIFYDSNENPLVVKPVGYEYSRYFAIGPTDPRVLTDTDAERITSIMAYGRLFISAMSMHECYLKDETTGEYLWKGINVID